MLAGLKRSADEDNVEAEKELSKALSDDVAAREAQRVAAKKRIMERLSALKSVQSIELEKTATKLLTARKSLANITSLLGPLRLKIDAMKKAIQFAREAGVGGGSSDIAMLTPLEKKAKTLSNMELKLTSMLKSTDRIYDTQVAALRETETSIASMRAMDDKKTPTLLKKSITGMTGASGSTGSEETGANGMAISKTPAQPTGPTGAAFVSAEMGKTGETGETGETGATGSIPDNIMATGAHAETGTHQSSHEIGSTGGSFGTSLTEQERDLTFNNYVKGTVAK
ncbi:MAG: hypothetical protein CMJ52_08295 [Planctomycetaceae bacterium]|nr:hypothetical protein [Planctomycetaceae bacterium]